MLTGPIRPRLEGHRYRSCGREGPPITFLDLGPDDVDTTRVWGANFAVRRSALERVGRFDERLVNGGDEEEWQARLARRRRADPLRRGRRRRPPPRGRRRAAALAAPGPPSTAGGPAGASTSSNGTAPPLAAELRVLAGCVVARPAVPRAATAS